MMNDTPSIQTHPPDPESHGTGVNPTSSGEGTFPLSSSQPIRRHGRGNVNRLHRISDHFYGDSVDQEEETTGNATRFPDVTFAHNLQKSDDVKKFHTKQSRRLPYWIWYSITRCLGIRLNPTDKPFCGTVMHMFTLLFALAFTVTFTWYTVYDIMSSYTKQTVLTGMVAIMIAVYWCALGIYANNLAAKLFSSQKFVESVRLHTRTIFKVSAAGLMIIIATASTVMNNYSAGVAYTEHRCSNITVSPVICYVMFGARVGYSIFSLIWNLLVGIVLLSVCRTHTIGIRRFIRQLETDGRMYEMYMRNTYMQGPRYPARQSDATEITDDEQYEWDEDVSPLSDEYCIVPSNHGSPVTTPTRRQNYPGFPGTGNTLTQTTLQVQGQTAGIASLAVDASGSTPLTETLVDIQAIQLAPSGGGNTGTLTAASGAAMSSSAWSVNSSSPCRVMAHASPANVPSDQNRPSPFRPENRPIIIIKEGSVATSEEIDLEVASVSSNNLGDATGECLKPDSKRRDEGSDKGETCEKTMLINPDPPSFASRSTQHSMRVELSSPRRVPSSMVSGATDQSSSADNLSIIQNMLSTDNILLCYYRIGCRLRSTSIALQRWLIAWIVFILVWGVTFLVSWVYHKATLLEIAAFVLPILLLPLICSAYGEVNMEGKRMIQCICPTEERVHMLMFLENQPLQLTAFGFPINYSTIMKTVGALAAAFTTKIALEKFNFFG